jgi:nicotinamide mononucleotide adenylyltransferase
MLVAYKTITGQSFKTAANKQVKEENDSIRSSEKLLFREVFAFVDSQLPWRLNAASFARVLAPYQWGKLKERAFGAKGTQVFFSYAPI